MSGEREEAADNLEKEVMINDEIGKDIVASKEIDEEQKVKSKIASPEEEEDQADVEDDENLLNEDYAADLEEFLAKEFEGEEEKDLVEKETKGVVEEKGDDEKTIMASAPVLPLNFTKDKEGQISSKKERIKRNKAIKNRYGYDKISLTPLVSDFETGSTKIYIALEFIKTTLTKFLQIGCLNSKTGQILFIPFSCPLAWVEDTETQEKYHFRKEGDKNFKYIREDGQQLGTFTQTAGLLKLILFMQRAGFQCDVLSLVMYSKAEHLHLNQALLGYSKKIRDSFYDTITSVVTYESCIKKENGSKLVPLDKLLKIEGLVEYSADKQVQRLRQVFGRLERPEAFLPVEEVADKAQTPEGPRDRPCLLLISPYWIDMRQVAWTDIKKELNTGHIIQQVKKSGGTKTAAAVPCRFFLQGTCKNGDRCTFLHSETKKPTVVGQIAGPPPCTVGPHAKTVGLNFFCPFSQPVLFSILGLKKTTVSVECDTTNKGLRVAGRSNVMRRGNMDYIILTVCPVKTNTDGKLSLPTPKQLTLKDFKMFFPGALAENMAESVRAIPANKPKDIKVKVVLISESPVLVRGFVSVLVTLQLPKEAAGVALGENETFILTMAKPLVEKITVINEMFTLVQTGTSATARLVLSPDCRNSSKEVLLKSGLELGCAVRAHDGSFDAVLKQMKRMESVWPSYFPVAKMATASGTKPAAVTATKPLANPRNLELKRKGQSEVCEIPAKKSYFECFLPQAKAGSLMGRSTAGFGDWREGPGVNLSLRARQAVENAPTPRQPTYPDRRMTGISVWNSHHDQPWENPDRLNEMAMPRTGLGAYSDEVAYQDAKQQWLNLPFNHGAVNSQPLYDERSQDSRPFYKQRSANIRPLFDERSADSQLFPHKRSAGIRPLFNDKSEDAQQFLKKRSADIRPLFDERSADIRPLFDERSADSQPFSHQRSAGIRPLFDEKSEDAQQFSKKRSADIRPLFDQRSADSQPFYEKRSAGIRPLFNEKSDDDQQFLKKRSADIRPLYDERSSESRPFYEHRSFDSLPLYGQRSSAEEHLPMYEPRFTNDRLLYPERSAELEELKLRKQELELEIERQSVLQLREFLLSKRERSMNPPW